MKTRLMCMLLSLALLLTQLPAAAFADWQSGGADLDVYAVEHPEEFMTEEAVKWERTYAELCSQPQAAVWGRRTVKDSEPRYIVLCIDLSGSMMGTPIAALKVAALRFCQQAFENTTNTHIAIVTYTDKAAQACGFSNDLATLTAAISSLSAFGATSQYRGLEKADELLSAVTVAGASKHIVLLSDGLPNGGPYTKTGPYVSSDSIGYSYANKAYALAHELHNEYSIYSLGFFHSLSGKNLAFGRRFMADLANCGYWEVTDPNDLTFTFGSIAESVVTARKGTFQYAGYINPNTDSSADYYYSDSYFSTPATRENPHLATMSLCLELSTWTSYSMGETWNAEKATRNVRALLDEIGYTGFKMSPDWASKPSMHSIGAVAAYKNIGDSTVVVLSMRGGGYHDEWGGNFVLGPSGNHRGFELARNEAVDFLGNYIRENAEAFGSTVKLWIVGFSRGGITANMVAGAVTDAGYCGGIAFRPEDIYAYTFEAPQGLYGSNAGYANIHNYINEYDIVPLVAPSLWGFGRYNAKDHQFISGGLGTKNYATLIGEMKKMLAQVVSGVPYSKDNRTSQYILEHYAYQLDFDVDLDAAWEPKWWNLFYVDVEMDIQLISPNYDLPTDLMLTRSMDTLFGNIPNGRIGYSQNMESAISHLLSFSMGFKNQLDWGKVFHTAFFANQCQGLRKTVAAYFSPLFPSPLDERAKIVAEQAAECICDAALQQTGTDLAEVKDALVSALVMAFKSFMDDPQQLFGFLYYVSSTSFQCHWPELALAWTMMEDSYYTDSAAFRRDYPEAYRVVHINCPVNITVLDEDGELFASIINDVVTNTSPTHGACITQDGTKQIILPSDAKYTIKIEPTGTGVMNYCVLEYNTRLNQYTMLQNFQNLSIEPGHLYTGYVWTMDEEDYQDEDGNGSGLQYGLVDEDYGPIPPTQTLRGSSIVYYDVTLTTNNGKGIVTGSGSHVVGSFAQVEAQCMPTVEFLGWYKGDALVSSDLIYRFEVTADTALQARFSEGDYHTFTLMATAGGSVPQGSCEVPAGLTLSLTAIPDEGYAFVRWDLTAGSIDDAANPSATFTMPACDATVVAVFSSADGSSAAPPPPTGDGTPLALYAGLMLLALAGAVAVLRRRMAR